MLWMALVRRLACRWTHGHCQQRSVCSAASSQRRRLVDRVLRVDHAGESAAVQIYRGQLAVLGNEAVSPTIQTMLEQELEHREAFERLIPEYGARPTALLPVWNAAAFTLGAATALLGKETAMACTVAVETAIGEHYDSQLRTLMADGPTGKDDHKELIETIHRFRDEELEHLNTGLECNAEQAPFYNVLSQVIQVGCKTAIWVAERV